MKPSEHELLLLIVLQNRAARLEKARSDEYSVCAYQDTIAVIRRLEESAYSYAKALNEVRRRTDNPFSDQIT